MGNIPLPALDVRPPQQQDLLGDFSKIQALRNMQQEGQMRQQQIESNQMDIDSQKALMRAYTEAQGDPDKTAKLAAQYGAKPQALLSWQNSVLEQKKNTLDLVMKQGDKAKQDADLMQGAHDAVSAAKPEDKPAVYQQQLQGLQQRGLDVSQMPPQYPGDEQFKFIGAVVKQHSAGVEEALKASETAKNTAQAQEAEQNTAKTKLELQWGGNPQMQETRYRAILQKLAAKQPVSEDDMAMATAYEASQKKTTTTSDSLGVTSTNTSGPTGLAQFRKPAAGGGGAGAGAAPNAKQSIVDMIGNYQADPMLMSRMFIKHPEILGLIRQNYPDFDQATYNAKNKMMVGYTSGSQSKEINAINTAMGHLKVLDDAVGALNNNDVTLLNKIGNQIGINLTGQTAAAAFKTILHRVGPEVASAYVPGGGGEKERIADAEDFSENLPGQTLHKNIGTSVTLLRSKVGALENQYKNTVGRDDFQKRFITPEAQAAFDRFAGQAQGEPSQKTKADPLGIR